MPGNIFRVGPRLFKAGLDLVLSQVCQGGREAKRSSLTAKKAKPPPFQVFAVRALSSRTRAVVFPPPLAPPVSSTCFSAKVELRGCEEMYVRHSSLTPDALCQARMPDVLNSSSRFFHTLSEEKGRCRGQDSR